MRVLFAFRSSSEPSPTTELFNQIDINKRGRISKDDVKLFLQQFDIKLTINNLDILAEVNKFNILGSASIQRFLERCGVEPDGYVSLKQFAHYVHEQDRHLSPIYAEMDRNMAGKVDLIDVQVYFLKFGIPLEPNEAKYLLRRVNGNNIDSIEYSEWRKFLLFLPICDIGNVAQFWRHGAVCHSCFSLISISQDYFPKSY